MTAQKLIEKASLMLGFSGENEQRIQENALAVVNAVYAELYFLENDNGFKEIEKFSDEIKLSERVLNDVMPYGVASLLAFSLGDTGRSTLTACWLTFFPHFKGAKK